MKKAPVLGLQRKKIVMKKSISKRDSRVKSKQGNLSQPPTKTKAILHFGELTRELVQRLKLRPPYFAFQCVAGTGLIDDFELFRSVLNELTTNKKAPPVLLLPVNCDPWGERAFQAWGGALLTQTESATVQEKDATITCSKVLENEKAIDRIFEEIKGCAYSLGYQKPLPAIPKPKRVEWYKYQKNKKDWSPDNPLRRYSEDYLEEVEIFSEEIEMAGNEIEVINLNKAGRASKAEKFPLGYKVLGFLANHPDWSDSEIAREVGCSRTSLYRFPKFKQARAIQRQGRDKFNRKSHL